MHEETLERQEYVISQLISKDALFNDIYLNEHLETMMYQLAIVQHIPAKILQDRREIARVPISIWQLIKSLLGFEAKYRIFYLNEHLTFPNIKWPKNMDKNRIYVDWGSYIEKRGDTVV